MIEVQNTQQDNILEIKALKKMSEEDLDKLTPILKDHVGAHSQSYLLVIIENFESWTDPTTFWKDLKLDTKFVGKFDRIAVVGDRKWEKWLTNIFGPIASSDIKYFERSDLSKARTWLK